MTDEQKSMLLIDAFDKSPKYPGRPKGNLYSPGNFFYAWNLCVSAMKELSNGELLDFYSWWAFSGMLEMPAGEVQRAFVDAVFRQARNAGRLGE